MPRSSRNTRSIAAELISTSSLVAQFDTEMRISATPCQVVPLAQQVPADAGDDPSGNFIVVAEADEDLVQHDVV